MCISYDICSNRDLQRNFGRIELVNTVMYMQDYIDSVCKIIKYVHARS